MMFTYKKLNIFTSLTVDAGDGGCITNCQEQSYMVVFGPRETFSKREYVNTEFIQYGGLTFMLSHHLRC